MTPYRPPIRTFRTIAERNQYRIRARYLRALEDVPDAQDRGDDDIDAQDGGDDDEPTQQPI